MVQDKRGQGVSAEESYTRAIEADGHDAYAYFSRAQFRLKLNKPDLALNDLARADELGYHPARVHFLRAHVYEAQGDAKSARSERLAGLTIEPEDGDGWVQRGIALARLGEPKSAVAAFDRALTFDPADRTALWNKAAVLAGSPHHLEDAVRVLDTVVRLNPNDLEALASRGVLLARLGRRGPAHDDARAVLSRDPNPPLVYQTAGVFALTSRLVDDDRREAFALLKRAFDRGAGLTDVDRDSDLDPLRGDPEFARLVSGARARVSGAARAPIPSPPPASTQTPVPSVTERHDLTPAGAPPSAGSHRP
ncbi:MAG: tetratricopeptide repeat protein [Isosphaeraceae bacterium]